MKFPNLRDVVLLEFWKRTRSLLGSPHRYYYHHTRRMRNGQGRGIGATVGKVRSSKVCKMLLLQLRVHRERAQRQTRERGRG